MRTWAGRRDEREAWLATVQRIMPDDCWNWPWGKNKDGYGQIHINGRQLGVHRVYYERLVGPIPAGLTIDHLCKNASCANPLHMEVVTMRENGLRSRNPAAINARKTHCKRGHLLSEENLLPCSLKVGVRACAICHRAWQRERYHRNKEIK